MSHAARFVASLPALLAPRGLHLPPAVEGALVDHLSESQFRWSVLDHPLDRHAPMREWNSQDAWANTGTEGTTT